MQTNSDGARLQMSGIVKRFGATTALAGVDLALRAGEIHALIGENGAGKSTLTKILAGAFAADAGEIVLDGTRYAPRSPVEAHAAGVAMIFQELSLAPHLSVAENVLLGHEPTRGGLLDRREMQRRAREALRQVGRGELDLGRAVGALPPADQQLVEIARSIALSARVIVLDEPTSSLGTADVARLFQWMRELRAKGTSIIYISHVLEDVFEIADRFTILRDGASVETGDMRATTIGRVVAAMVGREVSELYPRTPSTPGEAIARITKLAGTHLPREATLELRRGEVLGIAGLIGAGRTEFVRAIFGLDRVASGELRVLALDGARGPAVRWRQGVGMVSEDRKREGLAIGRSLSENLCLPRLDRLGGAGWLTQTSLDAAAEPWIRRLGIKCSRPAQLVGRLSGGNQQKVALARLLFAECDLLLLDEPTRGIDVAAKADVYHWIDELAHRAAAPKSVLVISSYLPELFGICDRIAVMSRGRLGPARPVGELDEHSVMLAAAGGGA
jgi:ribose transport system ATP-binding protein